MARFRLGSRVNQVEGVAAINTPIPEFGGIVIADTNLATPDPQTGGGQRGWSYVFFIADTIFAAGTLSNITGVVGPTFKAGTAVPGIFTAIKLASGSIVAYNAVEP